MARSWASLEVDTFVSTPMAATVSACFVRLLTLRFAARLFWLSTIASLGRIMERFAAWVPTAFRPPNSRAGAPKDTGPGKLKSFLLACFVLLDQAADIPRQPRCELARTSLLVAAVLLAPIELVLPRLLIL